MTGLGPLRTRLQRSAGRGLTKFVGREREMEAMRNTAELARAGRGQIEGDDPTAQMDGQIKKRRTLDAIKRILLRESLTNR